ncbi:MAG: coagulation factor 5/8 type domain-containing protein [Lachnospiraceae bacterium]|nr:coagulation factor 5/8 type domain-containing protein [Lachnospiraceae bacterium]
MKFNKILAYGTVTVLFAGMLTGCNTNKKDNKKSTNTSNKTATTVTNKIDYDSTGDVIKDDSVFGENVYVFSPDDDSSEVKEKIDDIYREQEKNQFGTERYAILFKPGEYDSSIAVNVGYYTTVAGLGISPVETNIEKLWVNADWMWHNATCNFWRGAENFSVNQYTMWANSQAVSLRRMNFYDGAVLSDGEGWSSGGFIADSKFEGTVSSGSQQQYLTRNCEWRNWEGGVWNMVFVGDDLHKIPMGGWPYNPLTKVEKTSYKIEKPFLVYDDEHGYGVYLPKLENETSLTTWAEGSEGTVKSLSSFYIAKPGDDASKINEELEDGKNILFTPGIYEFSETIKVNNPDTVIYGMGLATLVATEGNAVMETADVDGIRISGLIFEAGDKESETLLRIGAEKTDVSHEENPVSLNDVYFRVGGSGRYVGKVSNCVTINSNNVIGDNFWVWRADHGANVGWNVNTAKNGIIINGDNVTMYGLFVEHFQEYQTIWNGNGGKLYFYQSEIPYDVPNQEEFMSHDNTVNGYSSYKVSDDVTDHEAWGLGIYAYNRDAEVDINSAAEVPDVEGVKIHNIVSVVLNGHPGISHVVNDCGNPVMRAGNTSKIMEYENGVIK